MVEHLQRVVPEAGPHMHHKYRHHKSDGNVWGFMSFAVLGPCLRNLHAGEFTGHTDNMSNGALILSVRFDTISAVPVSLLGVSLYARRLVLACKPNCVWPCQAATGVR